MIDTRALRAAAASAVVALTLAACSSTADEPTPEVFDFPSDPLLRAQWGIRAAGIDNAWTVTGGAGVTVAVVDTGVDLDLPDFEDRLVPGYDFVEDDDTPQDENGHGTHVAGIVAASANDIGTVGTAPQASIMPIRVLDAEGAGTDQAIVDGIDWAVEHGADVINLSLGTSGALGRLIKGGAMNRAIRDATDAGVIVVAASGNDGLRGQQYEVDVDVLVVNASRPGGAVARFSNVGDARAITAPGVAILSTAPTAPTTQWPQGTNGVGVLSGTSMAAPLVAGAAALMVAAGVDRADVVSRLISTASNPAQDANVGAGLIDVGAALGLEPVAWTTLGPTPSVTPAPDASSTAAPNAGDAINADPSVVLTVTAPVERTVAASREVRCSVDGLTFTVTTDGADRGDTWFTLTGFPYRQAGAVALTGTLSIDREGDIRSVPISGVGTIDENLGGTLTVNDDEVSLSLAWTCTD